MASCVLAEPEARVRKHKGALQTPVAPYKDELLPLLAPDEGVSHVFYRQNVKADQAEAQLWEKPCHIVASRKRRADDAGSGTPSEMDVVRVPLECFGARWRQDNSARYPVCFWALVNNTLYLDRDVWLNPRAFLDDGTFQFAKEACPRDGDVLRWTRKRMVIPIGTCFSRRIFHTRQSMLGHFGYHGLVPGFEAHTHKLMFEAHTLLDMSPDGFKLRVMTTLCECEMKYEPPADLPEPRDLSPTELCRWKVMHGLKFTLQPEPEGGETCNKTEIFEVPVNKFAELADVVGAPPQQPLYHMLRNQPHGSRERGHGFGRYALGLATLLKIRRQWMKVHAAAEEKKYAPGGVGQARAGASFAAAKARAARHHE